MFSKLRKISPMVRAIGTMGAVAAVVGGITFAQLTSNTVALYGNELDATTHVLQISNGGAFGDNASGFSNSSLVLGKEGPKQAFYLQNLANVSLSICAQIANAGTVNNLNLADVVVNFYNENGSLIANPTFQALVSACQPLNTLNPNAQGNGGVPGTNGNYEYSITLQDGAVTGNPASIPTFDLDFTGTSV